MKRKRIDIDKDEPEGILITNRARKAFFIALENPSPPNAALKAAFKKHQSICEHK